MVATVTLCKRSGGYDCKSKQLKFKTTYRAEGTAADVDPGNLVLLMGSSLPVCQALYEDEDGDFHSSFMINIDFGEPTRKGSLWRSMITCIYESPKRDEDEDEPDPLQRCPEISVSDVTERTAATHLPFGGYFEQEDITCDTQPSVTLVEVNNQSVNMAADFTIQPIQNTLGQPLDPPPEIETNYKEYTFTFPRPDWEPEHITRQYGKFENRINSSQVTIDIPCREFKLVAPPYTLWLKSITPEFTSEQINQGGASATLHFVQVSYTVAYKPDGWFLDVANLSRHRRVVKSKISTAARVPDGQGGFYPYERLLDIPEGQSDLVVIKDVEGFPITDPFWINKDGDLLRNDKLRAYLRYTETCLANLADTKLGLVNWDAAP